MCVEDSTPGTAAAHVNRGNAFANREKICLEYRKRLSSQCAPRVRLTPDCDMTTSQDLKDSGSQDPEARFDAVKTGTELANAPSGRPR